MVLKFASNELLQSNSRTSLSLNAPALHPPNSLIPHATVIVYPHRAIKFEFTARNGLESKTQKKKKRHSVAARVKLNSTACLPARICTANRTCKTIVNAGETGRENDRTRRENQRPINREGISHAHRVRSGRMNFNWNMDPFRSFPDTTDKL